MESNKVVWVLHVCDGCHARNFEGVFASKETAEKYARDWFTDQGVDICDIHDDFDGFAYYGDDDVYAEAEKVLVLE